MRELPRATIFPHQVNIISRMCEFAIVILLVLILVWCDTLGSFHDWESSTRQIYQDLYPFIGRPNQLDPDHDGGAVWWKPAGMEMMNCVSLFDISHESSSCEDVLQADVCLKLYAGYELCPSKEAIDRQIQQLSEIPGVTYHADQRAFQISANSAHELFSTAHKMTRVTQGMEPITKRPSKIRDRLQSYSRELFVKPVAN